MHYIYIVSDGSGKTAEHTLNAAILQFSSIEHEIKVRPNIRTEAQALQVVQEAIEHNGIIYYTIVSNDLRQLIRRISKLQNVEAIDLLGPVLKSLAKFFSDSPSEQPGLFQRLNDSYFKRIDTMEFAIRHDDGQRADELAKAEIILLGVSRTFKTPLSIYLALKGWFVANIPIVLNIDPPAELFKIPPEKVIALITNPRRLAVLRKAREEYLAKATGSYADFDYVKNEVNYAGRIFSRQPKWKRVEVTDKPIEEISSEIIKILSKASKNNKGI